MFGGIRQATEGKAIVTIYYGLRLTKMHLAIELIEDEAEEVTSGLEVNEKNRNLSSAMVAEARTK
ncbi:hypothetical protein [Pontibacter vulgaris]|uniref:hypothetical protein n=1 Tax=Pontibacter vulgaris TaxID=2905679 RepID=UPI001FA78D9C|nr:hypothetical protein [Pontibacter vulgaris]